MTLENMPRWRVIHRRVFSNAISATGTRRVQIVRRSPGNTAPSLWIGAIPLAVEPVNQNDTTVINDMEFATVEDRDPELDREPLLLRRYHCCIECPQWPSIARTAIWDHPNAIISLLATFAQ
ncbi:hypothetical protein N7541_006407 [Penicillium brevicompactum]|uniref:Uncharacterized protein n=1 Tax=Penicillium brevicompactum TaxID=5074 RepID=A0A9W9UQI9_PENBR|nr:hypothetical protein N7541_006407 [Penicillium brevicompactum]